MRAKVAGRSLAPPRLKWCTPQLPHHRDGRVATALEDVRLPAATGQLASGALAFREGHQLPPGDLKNAPQLARNACNCRSGVFARIRTGARSNVSRVVR